MRHLIHTGRTKPSSQKSHPLILFPGIMGPLFFPVFHRPKLEDVKDLPVHPASFLDIKDGTAIGRQNRERNQEDDRQEKEEQKESHGPIQQRFQTAVIGVLGQT